MTPAEASVFRIQCSARHLRKSIANIANQIPEDTNTISLAEFALILEGIGESSSCPQEFERMFGFTPI